MKKLFILVIIAVVTVFASSKISNYNENKQAFEALNSMVQYCEQSNLDFVCE